MTQVMSYETWKRLNVKLIRRTYNDFKNSTADYTADEVASALYDAYRRSYGL